MNKSTKLNKITGIFAVGSFVILFAIFVWPSVLPLIPLTHDFVLKNGWYPALFFTFLGWLIASIHYEIKKPNIVFELVGREETGIRKIGNKDYAWKFINIIIHNKKRPWYKSWFWGNIHINNARGWVIFKDYQTKTILKTVDGRLNTTSEPIDGEKVNLGSIYVTSRESIPVGEKSGLAIALKTNQSEDVYGFNNSSYLYYPLFRDPNNTLWSKPDLEIGNDKKYLICVKVLAEGHEYRRKFLLINRSKKYDSIELAKIEGEKR